ncbi:MAG TPA: hypothetical protein ENJ02_10575 [Chloroflexi bacterium]|nr:hypothetical protein [Chloroflexota bacterium]
MRTFSRFALAVFTLVGLLACGILSELPQEAQSGIATAQNVATQAEEQGYFATAAALATEKGAAFVQTAQALATQAVTEGYYATAEAVATRQASGLAATLQALATQAADENYPATVQAFIATQGPESQATLQALATEGAAFFSGEAPADVPVLPGETTQFLANESIVSYLTEIPYRQAIDFYKEQLPANGWEPSFPSAVESETGTILRYHKPDRALTATIGTNEEHTRTVIVIVIDHTDN